MFTKKQIIIIVALIILAAAVILYQRLTGFGLWPQGSQAPSQSPDISASALPSESSVAKEPRDIVMEDVAKRIGEISPVEPVLGGKWYVLRYWFVDGSYSTFYVECEDGHIMRKLLLTADLSQMPKISYSVNAVFEPGESDWILKSGQDQTSSLPLILFELDQKSDRWIQKN